MKIKFGRLRDITAIEADESKEIEVDDIDKALAEMEDFERVGPWSDERKRQVREDLELLVPIYQAREIAVDRLVEELRS